jgi:hypothetical protein
MPPLQVCIKQNNLPLHYFENRATNQSLCYYYYYYYYFLNPTLRSILTLIYSSLIQRLGNKFLLDSKAKKHITTLAFYYYYYVSIILQVCVLYNTTHTVI